jgi:hypothetical protein
VKTGRRVLSGRKFNVARENENYLIPVMNRLARQARNINEAIALLQPLLAGEIGGATLFVDTNPERISPSVMKFTAAFLDSRQFPFRGLYTAPLKVGGRKVGLLVACFGSFGVPGKLLPALTSQLAGRLNEILARTSRAVTELAVSGDPGRKEAAC